VADGATEAVFAKLWANKLVASFVRNGFHRTGLEDQLSVLSAEWCAGVAAKPLPWYVEPKVAEGASAAFVGLEVNGRGRRGVWHATGLGDSCLFHIRAGVVRCTIPMACSSEFSNRPILVQSNAAVRDKVVASFWWESGRWQAGDSFLLMTDAIACWFMKQRESGEDPWRVLLDVWEQGQAPPQAFDEWVATVRGEGLMRNDDVTVVWARMGRH
jgi:hypothetical protein